MCLRLQTSLYVCSGDSDSRPVLLAIPNAGKPEVLNLCHAECAQLVYAYARHL